MSVLIERAKRHFLDGRDVHCGNALELQVSPEVWIPVRYEATWERDGIHVTLHSAFGTIKPFVRQCNFRWQKGGVA